MERLTTLVLDKQVQKFSIAHYTIFSATERERLHGHNYTVSVRLVAPIGINGFSADYNVYKRRIRDICDAIDEYMVLAENSPYQKITEEDQYYRVEFAEDVMYFLKQDTLVLALKNITVEELAYYMLDQLLLASEGEDLREIEVSVSSGPGQLASALHQKK